MVDPPGLDHELDLGGAYGDGGERALVAHLDFSVEHAITAAARRARE